MLYQITYLGQHEPCFAHIAFVRALAEVGVQRIGYIRLMPSDALAELDEPRAPRLDVERRARLKECALRFDNALYFFDIHYITAIS